MSNDIERLRDTLAVHDPARDVRVTDEQVEQALHALATGSVPARPAARPGWRRRMLVGIPVTVAVTAAAVVGVQAVRTDESGTPRVGTARALAFAQRGEFLEVRIVDPNADPEMYRKQFATHGLNVDLRVLPVSPSLVGTMLSYDEQTRTRPRVTPLDGGGGCGDLWCQPGVRVPTGLRDRVTLTFGRAARPGERYQITGDAAARGEPLNGVRVKGTEVGELRRVAKERGVRIVGYAEMPPRPEQSADWDFGEHVLKEDRVPDSWYVHEAVSGKEPKSVTLHVASGR
ncbi:hypothetical protein [Actinomadura kijaniata]|uniref:hypothetical protein n=1 Tax=Actinomadura kijaniata TaxID=46161 RepID=UPI00082ED128|nr:hypothetical protein [Actinomadura kijaniata]